MLYIPKIEVKEFAVINFDEYFKSTQEKMGS